MKLDLPHWRAFSGSISHALTRGVGDLPIAGGLFLGDDGVNLLASTDQFAVTQDQRHTLRSRVSCQIKTKAWVALAISYGSGLPFEFVGEPDEAIAQYGQRIVDAKTCRNTAAS